MNKYDIISKIVTNMAKDETINLEIPFYCLQIGDENEELFNLMIKWNKTTCFNKKNDLVIAMNDLIEDYKTFGNKMYGLS